MESLPLGRIAISQWRRVAQAYFTSRAIIPRPSTLGFFRQRTVPYRHDDKLNTGVVLLPQMRRDIFILPRRTFRLGVVQSFGSIIAASLFHRTAAADFTS
jgi:hypothetical protein